MQNYTDDTFQSIWTFVDKNENIYTVVREKQTELFKVFLSRDVVEISHTNYVVKSNYKELTGKFFDYIHGSIDSFFYVVAQNNVLHCELGPAAFVPAGLEVYKPKEDVYHYIIHGKIMSQHSWLTWVRSTSSWPAVMANLLGSKDKY